MWSYAPPLADMRFVLDEVLAAPALLERAAGARRARRRHRSAGARGSRPLRRRGDRADERRRRPRGLPLAAGRRGAHAARLPRGLPRLRRRRLAGARLRPRGRRPGPAAAARRRRCTRCSAPPTTAGRCAPGLLHGAYECLQAPRQRRAEGSATWPKIASGDWLATMCLTEPQAGSDLGLVRTRARAAGRRQPARQRQQDLHLRRRARPDRQHRPPGAVPPARRAGRHQGPVAGAGAQAAARRRRNAVRCERIEEKMGLHGQRRPACCASTAPPAGWSASPAAAWRRCS